MSTERVVALVDPDGSTVLTGIEVKAAPPAFRFGTAAAARRRDR